MQDLKYAREWTPVMCKCYPPPILLGTSASVGFSIQGGPESGPHGYWGTTVHINSIWRWIHTYAYRTDLLSVCREQRKPLAFLGQWPWPDFITSCAPLSNPSFWISSASVLWLHGQESSTASQAMSFPVGCSVPGKGRCYPPWSSTSQIIGRS